MHSWQQDLGEQIRRARDAAGLSQEALADKLSVTRGQLSNYENGKSAAPVNVVAEIAAALGVEFIVRGCRITRDDSRNRTPQPLARQLSLEFNKEYKFSAASVSITPSLESILITATVPRSRS